MRIPFVASRADAGGPGIIGLTTLDGNPAKKLIHLEEADYHRALRAHDEGKVLRVAGNLEREGNLSWLYQARILEVTDDAAVERLDRDQRNLPV